MHIAERAAAWSAAHWKTAIGGWIALVVGAIALGIGFGAVELTDAEAEVGESATFARMLEEGGFDDPATETVMVTARQTGTAIEFEQRRAHGDRGARDDAGAHAARA